MRERLVFGEADNHMPPGWGAIPLAQVAAILRDANYAGILLVEVDSRYLDMRQEILAGTRAIIGHM